ncbi:cytosine permease [Streptomyces sp. NPDC002476]|uniref:cytosine permease n=1 Tax=Streptomyces sp. NPDC002476 TaxID=3364648 RepID=UPI00368DEF1A
MRAVGLGAAINPFPSPLSLFLSPPPMTTATGFMDAFASFLSLFAVTFAAWIGVFGADQPQGRVYDPAALLDTGPGGGCWYTGGFSVPAAAACAAGPVAGVLPTGASGSPAHFPAPGPGGTGRGGWPPSTVSGALHAALPRPVAGHTGGRRDDAPLHF